MSNEKSIHEIIGNPLPEINAWFEERFPKAGRSLNTASFCLEELRHHTDGTSALSQVAGLLHCLQGKKIIRSEWINEMDRYNNPDGVIGYFRVYYE